MDPERTVLVAGTDAGAVAERAREAGLGATVVAADAVGADADAIVAVGEAALVTVARQRPATPVLPVDAGPGVGSVAREDLAPALAAVAEGAPVRERALLTVRAPDGEVTALFDATLVAAPTRMSEYAVGAPVDGERRTVERVRADGVVVATPAGSVGYARAAGGPLAAPGTGVAVVVPLAPYAVDRDRWVLAPPVSVAVEREEGAVTLLADGREVGPVGPGERVAVAADGSLPVVAAPGTGFPDS